jgi:hypothetical protein
MFYIFDVRTYEDVKKYVPILPTCMYINNAEHCTTFYVYHV